MPGIDDSKKLTPTQRNRQYERLYGVARSIGIGVVDVAEIDRINILQATLQSMAMAVANLQAPAGLPAHRRDFHPGRFTRICPSKPSKRGTRLSISIAAASIVAKVTRDRIMTQVDDAVSRVRFQPAQGLSHQNPSGGHCHDTAVVPSIGEPSKGVREYIDNRSETIIDLQPFCRTAEKANLCLTVWQQFGKKSERLAAEYLKLKGYRIIETNYRSPAGEIDIIAREKETLVFVEVKARRSSRFGSR